MQSDGLKPKILLIVDASTAEESLLAVISHLKEVLAFETRTIRVEDYGPKDGMAVDLVAVSAASAPPLLRSLSKPVLALNRNALYDLGMTMAMEDRDFGSKRTPTIHMAGKATGHPLTGGLSNIQTVSADDAEHGWARLDGSAIVAATLADAGGSAVVFGYEVGVQMPALIALHRRVGFLLGQDGFQKLTQQGWRLFDASVSWAVAGGEIKKGADEKPTKQWFSAEGEPTRQLSIQEYRDWVQERVARRLWFKISAVFSVIGIAGVVAIGTLALKNMDGMVASKLEEQLPKKVKAEVATTLLELIEVRKEAQNAARTIVKEELKGERFKELVKKTLKEKEHIDMIVKAATDEIGKSDYLDGVLAKRFKPLVTDEQEAFDINRRIFALKQLLLFAIDKSELHGILVDIMKSTRPHDAAIKREVLISYMPSEFSAGQRVEALETGLSEVWGAEKLSSPRDREEQETFEKREKAYIDFFAKFESDEEVDKLAHFIRANPSSQTSRWVFKSLCKIDGDRPVKNFGRFLDDRNGYVKAYGWEGLSTLSPGRTISPQLRTELLGKIWHKLDEKVSRRWRSPDYTLWGYANRFFSALRQNDPHAFSGDLIYLKRKLPNTRLEALYKKWRTKPDLFQRFYTFDSADTLFRYLLQRPFFNLLRPEDWGSHVKKWLSSKTPDTATLDSKRNLLFLDWVDRLELHENDETLIKNMPPRELYDICTARASCISRSGCARAVDWALKKGGDEIAAEYLNEVFPGQTWDRRDPNQEELQRFLLTTAIQKATQPKTHTEASLRFHELLDSLIAEEDWLKTGLVIDALKAVRSDPDDRPEPKIPDFLKAVIEAAPSDEDGHKALRTAIVVASERRYSSGSVAQLVESLMRLLKKQTNIKYTGRKGDWRAVDGDVGSERKIEIVDAVIDAFNRHYDSLKEEKDIMVVFDTIFAGLPPPENDQLALVRLRLVEFMVEKSRMTRRDQRLSLDEKLGILSKGIELDQRNDPKLFEERARIYYGKKNYAKAAEDLEKAMALGDKNYLNYKILGLLQFKLGQLSNAEVNMREAVKIAENDRRKAGAMENLSLLYLKRKRWRDALENSEAVKAVGPDGIIGREMAWNWLIQAMAAWKLEMEDRERDALQQWQKLGRKSTYDELKEYLPDLINSYEAAGRKLLTDRRP